MAMSPYIRDLRARVGTTRLLVPSVSGIVRDADDRILLVQQRDDQVWSTPGGSIELDETPAEAVVREVWEETGLHVSPQRIIGVYGGPMFVVRYPNGDETQYISTIFECDLVAGKLGGDPDEVIDARFLSLEDASRLRLSPWLPRVLPRLFDRGPEAWFEHPTWQPGGSA